MPFAPAPKYSADQLTWMPEGFAPYSHQARAFARLNSALGRPRPTLVTTGTGSGKTEAFLLPILDHVVRARHDGVGGTKALILYPMNALANDQAQRLANLIATDGQLTDVTAAIYTGEQESSRTTVDGLITDRAVIRDTAPDILLTNYKMLDQLLLRHEDQRIWQQSAESLQYLVLDEFHTYDGAQGTDVAMLLRRLGLALKSYWPERGSQADTHTAEEWQRPLGRITPVGTSATLGTAEQASTTVTADASSPDLERSGNMVSFATTVFGEPFDASCVVTESRRDVDDWAGDAQARLQHDGVEPCAVNALMVTDVLDAVAGKSPDEACTILLTSLYEYEGDPTGRNHASSHDDLVTLAKGHPFIREFLKATADATHVRDLADRLLPGASRQDDPRVTFLLELIGALGHLRALPDRDMPSTETHLWIRELSRIDRDVSTATNFRWSDDGTLVGHVTDDGTEPGVVALPAVYCRRCGRSGWGVQLASTGYNLSANDDSIRRIHAAHEGRFRALLSAPREGARAVDTGEAVASLCWFDTVNRCLDHHIPDADSPEYRNGVLLPVLTQTGQDADKDAKNDVCPSCGAKDAIRFQGSAIATLLSVNLSTLFGSDDLDEKKALVFTDSVQDAAHRAGFISARSHALTLRAILRSSISDEPATIPELVSTVLNDADDSFKRYRLLPTELAEQTNFRDFWRSGRDAIVPKATLARVRDRLTFDTILELGLQSRYGRTLEQTGSICVEVEAGSFTDMAGIGRKALGHHEDNLVGALAGLTDSTVVAWVRGVLERIRTQGGIHHPWLETYLEHDGARWYLWGGRRKSDGMPAFPPGRSAPAFPRVGGQRVRHEQLDNVTDGQSWYARWTGRVLGVSPGHGARLARSLLECLRHDGVLTAMTTQAQATVYGIPHEKIVVRATRDEELLNRTIVLRCDLCQAVHAGSPDTIRQLSNAPCLNGNCGGHLTPAPMAPDNFYRGFYRTGDPRRIVAREHTSMLSDQQRLEYENGFKAGSTDPSAPNVLVATPTLEMGIDIGDLSTVFLSSLPRNVANYVQRVGRAGRATGSALDVTMVRGRGEHLPRLGDPTSMINGQVRPPATYLSAGEILRRQYVAHLGDELARDPNAVHPHTSGAAMNGDDGGFLATLVDHAEAHADEHVDRFLSTFAHLRADSIKDLRAWATPVDGPRTSGLARQVFAAATRWAQTLEELEHRRTTIAASLPELRQKADIPNAGEDDRRACADAEATIAWIRKLKGKETQEYWIATLEEYGLFPNYTLVDDSVELDVSLSWYDPDEHRYQDETASFSRGSAAALRDFAPGATFYALGHAITIDAIDLGRDGESIHTLAVCPSCGYTVDQRLEGTPAACPRCHDHGIADTGQHLEAVELTRTSAAIKRDESRIDDAIEERVRTNFTVVPAADIDPSRVHSEWYVQDTEFGARYLDRMDLRWINLGKEAPSAPRRQVAGFECHTPLFRVCEGCGHLDRTTGTNHRSEHRPWCRYRDDLDEHVRTVALTRSLTTQAVVLPLPASIVTGDMFALPSLRAALLLGLREQFGGTPDHLGIMAIKEPVDGRTRDALLLHDLVPGGTGYLAEFTDPQNVWEALRRAFEIVRDCQCKDEERLACHRCLLPLASARDARYVSRAKAEDCLKVLMGLTDGDTPSDHMTWEIVTTPATISSDDESYLESRFRESFMALARRLNATVSQNYGPGGNVINVRIGQVLYTLQPQVSMPGCKPDFVLRGGGRPDLAIFTDGATFHATPAHNRVRDDAEKRAGLRNLGVEVLAVTLDDVNDFEAKREPAAPAWFNASASSKLIGLYDYTSDAVRAITGGPFALLEYWMRGEPLEALTHFTSAIPMFFSTNNPPDGYVDPAIPIAAVKQTDLIDSQQADPGTVRTWWRQDGPLSIRTRLRTSSFPPDSDICVVLDDDAVTSAEFTHAWHQWLALSNALMLRKAPNQTVISGCVEPPQSAEQEAVIAEPVIDIDQIPWPTVIDDLGPSLATPELPGLLQDLAAQGVPEPVAGKEVGSEGIMVDLAWPDSHVAVIFAPEPDDGDLLAEDGWTLVRPTAHDITTALDNVASGEAHHG
ncbi:DEAD/DEAH box helicase [Cutibacterium sp. WCA-380-WT-3A]|uniref:DEAD/DEAH box helicase n=2 Tax=Cutibacterium porci TaxID=2605781 RepID=A0A7K0J9Z9_9ACTN|nr:DEAD/DEAH box helicase [Cutibacterium porci]